MIQNGKLKIFYRKEMENSKMKYIFVNDDDGHWYINS